MGPRTGGVQGPWLGIPEKDNGWDKVHKKKGPSPVPSPVLLPGLGGHTTGPDP